MIEIETLYAESSPCGVFCKGNIPDGEFLAAVREFDRYQDEDNADYIESAMLDGKNPICRRMVRMVPYNPGEHGDIWREKGSYFHPAKPGRGAFWITYVDEDDCILWDRTEA